MVKARRRLRRLSAVGVAVVVAAALVLPAMPAGARPRSDGPRDHGGIRIDEDSEFDREHGVVSGSGTARDPYVISGWNLHYLVIKDTASHVVIRDNDIGFMVLDWIGRGAHVYDNDVGDLRVNQNVKRTGEATSGVISRNRFDVVGQLRHWDGVFEHNVVGSPEGNGSIWPDTPWWKFQAVNFDGFNGAVFRNNTLYGYMDARLHGHHHSSSFGGNSHYHGAAPDHGAHGGDMDHSQRYHEVFITDNTIVSDFRWALRYTDTAHSANDRTAASERDEDLNKPHVHYTRVHIAGNKLVGSGLWVDVFNAADSRHLGSKTGLVDLRGNAIEVARSDTGLWDYNYGIYVREARDLKLQIAGNAITGPEADAENPADVADTLDNSVGIYMSSLEKARAYLVDNTVVNSETGIKARQFPVSVMWWVRNFKTDNVGTRIDYDGSVRRGPG